MIGDQAQIKSKNACLVVSDKSLALSVLVGLEGLTVDTVATLSELEDDSSYEVLVIDTGISDITSLPLVRLKRVQNPKTTWVFLVNHAEDVTKYLNPLPEGSLVFLHGPGTDIELSSLLKKMLDFEADEKFDVVDVIPDMNALSVRMFNGKSYLLFIADIDEDDASGIEYAKVSSDRFHIEAMRESGNHIEIPWDTILYHCEPDYAYYKGRLSGESSDERAIRIGLKVKEVRTNRGLSISRLAAIVGMQRPNLSRLEHGKHFPSLETLERIADGLGVPVVELLVKDSTPIAES